MSKDGTLLLKSKTFRNDSKENVLITASTHLFIYTDKLIICSVK